MGAALAVAVVRMLAPPTLTPAQADAGSDETGVQVPEEERRPMADGGLPRARTSVEVDADADADADATRRRSPG